MGNITKRDDFLGRDILSIDDFSREEIDYILCNSKNVEENSSRYKEAMEGKVMVTFFSEWSTRTKNSFKMAMFKMDGKVLDFDVSTSSLKKGETLEDTARIIDGYCPDVVVMRYKVEGVPNLFADVISAPVINGGDGRMRHPTQALLDLYTIKSFRGSIDGLKIAIAGDLKYGRTVRSLSTGLTKYKDCKIYFISPESLKIPKELGEKLDGILKFEELGLESLEDIINDVDVLYMTRIQRERFPEGPEGENQYSMISSQYKLTKEMLDRAKLKEEFKIMHPLPKVDEIEKPVDYTDYAYYFQQSNNGLYVRKLLLMLVTGSYKDEL